MMHDLRHRSRTGEIPCPDRGAEDLVRIVPGELSSPEQPLQRPHRVVGGELSALGRREPAGGGEPVQGRGRAPARHLLGDGNQLVQVRR
ncbi:MAG: hypothetical protein AB7J32_26640, partial [Pseudonocardia sp.]